MIEKKIEPYWIVSGIVFALLWASASTATKIGLSVAQPLVIAVVRFGMAATIMLAFAHCIKRQTLPSGKQWGMLALYGLLNITIYLGSYIIAMQHVTAGIGSLSIASNPVFISFLSVFFLKKKLSLSICIAMIFGTIGVVIAAWPLFATAVVTPFGVALLFFSMFSYSASAIFFTSRKWDGLNLITINGWQTLIGGIFLLPFALFNFKFSLNNFNLIFWMCAGWLAVPVSIGAVLLWLKLLKANPLRASVWLFLCPVFGFILAALIMKEPLTVYTFVGVTFVLTGLFISQKIKPTLTSE